MSVFRITKKKIKPGLFTVKLVISKGHEKSAFVRKDLFKNPDVLTFSTNYKHYRWYFTTSLQAQSAVKRLNMIKNS